MNNVIEIVTNMTNPFDVQDDGMINIASGTLATEDDRISYAECENRCGQNEKCEAYEWNKQVSRPE